MGFESIDLLNPRTIAKWENAEVIFDDDFSDGLQGWSGLRNTGINRYPTLHPYCSSGQNSMCLAVTDGVANTYAAASKRTSMRAMRYRWHSRVGWTSDVEASSLRYLRWSIDQEDATDRYWVDLRYTNWDEATGDVVPKWEINTGNGVSFVYTDIGLDYELGFNQRNKVDFADVVLEVDLGTKKYVSLQVNDVTVDLSGYTLSPSAKIPEPDTYFTNGQNFLFWCVNRSNNGDTMPIMFIDQTRAEVLP